MLILVSIALGFLLSSWWFILTGLIAFYLLQHAAQGWCPPLPVLRKLGVRTMTEIDAEKTTLKFLRGDFENAKPDPINVLEAAKR